MLPREILSQMRHNGDDLSALKSSLGRVEDTLDRIDVRLDRLASEFRRLESDLPAIISQAMRAVWRESGHA